MLVYWIMSLNFKTDYNPWSKKFKCENCPKVHKFNFNYRKVPYLLIKLFTEFNCRNIFKIEVLFYTLKWNIYFYIHFDTLVIEIAGLRSRKRSCNYKIIVSGAPIFIQMTCSNFVHLNWFFVNWENKLFEAWYAARRNSIFYISISLKVITFVT